MFMLGSFTNGARDGNGYGGGLFAGASDVFRLASNFMDLKDRLRSWRSADEIQGLMQRGDQGGGSAGFGQALEGTTGSNAAGTYAGRPDYETFDDDPDLASLPKLAKKTALALKGFTSSPSEGRGVYGRSQTSAADSPREGKSYGNSGGSAGALQRLSGQTGPDETEGAQAGGDPSIGGSFDWLGKIGSALRGYSAQRLEDAAQGQQQPPSYLPPQQPVGPGAPPGPGTLDTLQQHGALGGAGAGVPYAGGPSLGNQMNPLGQRIMAALTPSAGSVT